MICVVRCIWRKVREKGKNAGSEYYDEIGYFGKSLKMLLHRLIDIYVHENLENQTYEQLLDFCKDIVDLQEKLLKGGD